MTPPAIQSSSLRLADKWMDFEFDPVTETFTILRYRAFESRGLGDSIAKVTDALGIKKCGGCGKRQEALNKLVPYGAKT